MAALAKKSHERNAPAPLALLAVFICAAIVAAVCTIFYLNGAGPNVVPVEGVVTLDGVPVPDLEVVFWPVGGGHASLGQTDGNGKYEFVS